MSKRREEENRERRQQESSTASDADQVERHRLFSSLFFERHQHHNDSISSDDETSTTTNSGSKNHKPPKSQELNETEGNVDSRKTFEQQQKPPQSQIDGVLSQIDKQIPHDRDALRQTQLYTSALQMLQYQRDNYLVGREYADWRKNDRQREQKRNRKQEAATGTSTTTTFDIPYDKTALGHQQFAGIAKNFVPSETVKKALTPIVASLPCGALYDPTRNALVNIIHGQNTNLENTMKPLILQFLDNPKNRTAMKNSTQGIIVEKTNKKKNNDGYYFDDDIETT